MTPFEPFLDRRAEWRTTTVVGMCASMRETHDHSPLPILADALEEAGFDMQPFLAAMRGQCDVNTAARITALLYSPESAAAVQWIDELADQIAGRTEADKRNWREYADPGEEWKDYYSYVDFYYVMRAGAEALRTGGFCWPTDDGGDLLRNDEIREQFWDNWQLVSAVVVGVGAREQTYFRCAC